MTPKTVEWKEGKVITFRGCCWDDGWEFNGPLVLYSPVLRYSETGSLCEAGVYEVVEDACVDLCVHGRLAYSHPCDIKEFKWRGWSVAGFRRRKNAVHGEFKIKCVYDDDGERSFEVLKVGSWHSIAHHFGAVQ